MASDNVYVRLVLNDPKNRYKMQNYLIAYMYINNISATRSYRIVIELNILLRCAS